MSMTIDSTIRWWSQERPNQLALVDGDDRVDYATLHAWVGRVAGRLAAVGVGPGDRVCISGQNSIEWCVTALATLRAGGIVAGLSHRMVADEVAFLLGDYSPTVLVVDDVGAKVVAGVDALTDRHGTAVDWPEVISTSVIGELRSGPEVDVGVEVDPDAPAVIVTTSGSTARPKGVMFSNHSILDVVAAFMLEDPVRAQPAKMFVVAPFNTTAGGVLFLHSLIQGGTCYFAADFDPAYVLETIATERIAIFCGAPIFLQRIADLPEFATSDVSCLEISYTGGAAVAPKLLATWGDKGVIVRQMYGQTESGGWGVNNPREFAFSDPDRCGRGSPTKDIAIIDDDGRFLPPETPGQIVMRGPGIMLGYWNDPEATARTLVDGWLRTGDIGVIDDRGLLKFVDRAKNIIISGGLNISAAEVERVLMEQGSVEEVAVFAAPDERFGETPLAVVYGPRLASVTELVSYCDEHLSSYKVPRYIVVRGEPLPRLATGKISKPALRAEHLGSDTPLPERVR